MIDYGRTVEFGVSIYPYAANYQDAVAQTRRADELGLDLIGIQDHPYNADFFDTWALIAALIPQTSRIHIFPNVTNLPLRPPAMLAKTAASLDIMSGGRVEVGLGTGWQWDGIRAMGGPSRSGKSGIGALEEAIQVMKIFWSGQADAVFDGTYYSLQGAQTGPRPAHSIGIWIGALGPQTLSITGRFADGWSASVRMKPGTLLESQARIDEAAVSVGRNPVAIRRMIPLPGRITSGAIAGSTRSVFDGPAAQWVDTLCALALNSGIDTFIFWPQGNILEQIERFAVDVIPQVRANVARRRSVDGK
jgi:alkanesulfonate monooxygenase SsuD/methylene tetrahydromethanopterin reductase-like flavin-dependent oxidoreductase (luciferase family)